MALVAYVTSVCHFTQATYILGFFQLFTKEGGGGGGGGGGDYVDVGDFLIR